MVFRFSFVFPCYLLFQNSVTLKIKCKKKNQLRTYVSVFVLVSMGALCVFGAGKKIGKKCSLVGALASEFNFSCSQRF